jgi:hypothetical protein
MVVNNELEKIWKFKILSQQLPGEKKNPGESLRIIVLREELNRRI